MKSVSIQQGSSFGHVWECDGNSWVWMEEMKKYEWRREAAQFSNVMRKIEKSSVQKRSNGGGVRIKWVDAHLLLTQK